ncbi:MAG: M16 family metallopeptidase [Pyrinomonadaceae bacterium]
MNTKYFNKLTLLFLILFLSALNSLAQTTKLPTPREEKLLNGLKLLVWNLPNAEKVSVQVRIHSGSAFDQQNKEGTMALLADALFPNESVKEFFREDLGGNLEVTSNFDYIQIDATATPDQFLTLLETLANAVTNLRIDKEITAKLRAARLEKIKELEKNPAYIADQAAAERLFGDFPYGRSQAGTSETLAKIDFADLMLAKERFLTPDNTTIAVAGNVKQDLVIRAARRFFGSWVKADKKVPATFRQPEAPDSKAIIINSPLIENSEIRYALRGLSRNDKDFFASAILVKIMQNRLQKEFTKERQITAFVRQDSNLLPGSIIVGLSNFPFDAKSQLSEKPPRTHMIIFKEENLAANLAYEKISAEEFEKAKNEILTEANKKNSADLWLDIDTFKLVSTKDEFQKINNVSITDVQKFAARLVKEPTVTVVIVKSTDEKKM